MRKEKGNILIIALLPIITFSLIAIGMFLNHNYNKDLSVNKNSSQPQVKNNSLVNNDYYNCNFSGSFGKEGGIFLCQNGGGVKIQLNTSKFPDFKSDINISVPSNEKIRETLSSEIPYAGAIEINMTEPEQSLPENISEGDMNFIITVPLKSKLSPVAKLEVRLKGEDYGEWSKQFDSITHLETFAIVGQDGLTAFFKPETAAVGIFVVRLPDKFSIPTINYDTND